MSGDSKTVLLVEDEYDTRELLARALTRAGYTCPTAADREAALAAVQDAEALDCVITDVVLGSDGYGGLELLKTLRARGVPAPVIIITAYADVEKLKIALNEGAAFCLEKPFSAQKLGEAVARVLSSRRPLDQAVEDMLARASLTEKELTVARHLLEGRSSNEIAALERNSPKTIRQHVTQIYAKCGVTTRAQFFRLAYLR